MRQRSAECERNIIPSMLDAMLPPRTHSKSETSTERELQLVLSHSHLSEIILHILSHNKPMRTNLIECDQDINKALNNEVFEKLICNSTLHFVLRILPVASQLLPKFESKGRTSLLSSKPERETACLCIHTP